jgi:hypothetical protein
MTDASPLRAILVVALATASLAIAGCGGGDDEGGEASKAARSGAVSLQQAMDTASRAIDEVRGTKSSLERLSSRLEPAISQTGDVVVLLTPEAADGEAEARLLTGARQQRTFLQYAQDAAGASSESAASSALRRARSAGRQASATYARVAREYPDLAGVMPDATSFNTGRLSDAIRSAYGSKSGGGTSGSGTSGGGTSGGGTTGGGTTGGGTTSGTASCGGGVSVNANTSCPFGLNVAETYRASGGETVIEVFSPVTDRSYTMTCTGAAPVVCRGGNNAVVYIR